MELANIFPFFFFFFKFFDNMQLANLFEIIDKFLLSPITHPVRFSLYYSPNLPGYANIFCRGQRIYLFIYIYIFNM